MISAGPNRLSLQNIALWFCVGIRLSVVRAPSQGTKAIIVCLCGHEGIHSALKVVQGEDEFFPRLLVVRCCLCCPLPRKRCFGLGSPW